MFHVDFNLFCHPLSNQCNIRCMRCCELSDGDYLFMCICHNIMARLSVHYCKSCYDNIYIKYIYILWKYRALTMNCIALSMIFCFKNTSICFLELFIIENFFRIIFLSQRKLLNINYGVNKLAHVDCDRLYHAHTTYEYIRPISTDKNWWNFILHQKVHSLTADFLLLNISLHIQLFQK